MGVDPEATRRSKTRCDLYCLCNAVKLLGIVYNTCLRGEGGKDRLKKRERKNCTWALSMFRRPHSGVHIPELCFKYHY